MIWASGWTELPLPELESVMRGDPLSVDEKRVHRFCFGVTELQVPITHPSGISLYLYGSAAQK